MLQGELLRLPQNFLAMSEATASRYLILSLLRLGHQPPVTNSIISAVLDVITLVQCGR
jgi:hypothetical protein